ncbi:MAG: amino acid transporter [Caldilineaceae bacterium]|nr:amino acid transporter [Caldilineaceae bacterium]
MSIQFAPQSVTTFIQGFLLCASLVMVIGPQNMFLIQQGLHRRHLFLTACLCTVFDLILISLGIGGVGTAIAANERLLHLATLSGAIFLFGYGIRTLHAVWCTRSTLLTVQEDCALSMKRTMLTVASFSLLNPATYLDTLLMIGTTSGRYPVDERLIFGVGAIMASALWFFIVTYGAGCLRSLLQSPTVWRALDIVSACVMLGIAISISASQLQWLGS